MFLSGLSKLAKAVVGEKAFFGEDDEEPVSEAAAAQVEVVRELLRTPVSVGDAGYETLLARVYELATGLLDSPDHSPPATGEEGAPLFHRTAAAEAGWSAIGFQATAPDREFRGGGLLGLHCLLFVLEHHGGTCREILRGPFPFAAASINMTLVTARLAGVVVPLAARRAFGSTEDVDSYGEEDRGRRAHLSRASIVGRLMETSHDGFFEVHAAALGALERARRDVDAGAMDFAGCAAAARDEVAVLLAHRPRDVAQLRFLVETVPRRRSGFLDARQLPGSSMRGRRAGRKWCALSTGTLRWYDESEVHSHSKGGAAAVMLNPGTPAGTFRLRPGLSVKFRNENSSFSINDGGHAVLAWFVAKDTPEMQQWCIALAEHINMVAHADGKIALAAPGLKPTLSSTALYEDEAKTELGQRFRVSEHTGVYVRTTPDVAATRTGRALMPGAIVTAVERRRIEDDAAGPQGRSFLLLAAADGSLEGKKNEDPSSSPKAARTASDEDGPGWVMEHHPTTYDPILVRDPTDR